MEDGLLSLKWNNHRSTFFHVLAELREKSQYSDVTLACDGELFRTHRLVLSTCSDYFAAMLESTQCKSPVIVLKDIKKDHLTSLLRYMYIGEVEVRQNDLSGLIKAAECLRIKGLAVPDQPPEPMPVQKLTPRKAMPARDRQTSPNPARKRVRRDSGDSQSSNTQSKRVNNIGSDSESAVPSPSPTPVTIKTEAEEEDSTQQSSHSDVFTSDQIKVEPDIVESNNELDSSVRSGPGAMKGENRSCDISNMEDSEGGGFNRDKDDSNQQDLDIEQIAGPSRLGDGLWAEGSEGAFPHELFDVSEDMNQQQLNMESFNYKEEPFNDKEEPFNYKIQPMAVFQDMSCPFCSFTAKHRSLMVRHMRTHTGEKPYKCTYCDYTCAAKHNLKPHEDTHREDKIFKCSYCNHRSVSKHMLKRHVRTHTGEKPFKCSMCSYSATRKDSLTRHERSHNKEPLKCSICQMVFRTLPGLEAHIKTHIQPVDELDEIANTSTMQSSATTSSIDSPTK